MSGVYPFRPESGEPAVHNPALAELVQLARHQTVPRVGVTAEELTEAYAQTRRRHGWILGAMAATAAGLLGAFLAIAPGGESSMQPAALAEASPSVLAPAQAVVPTSQVEHDAAAEPQKQQVVVDDTKVASGVALARGVEVRQTRAVAAEQSPPVVVHSTWAVEVAAGVYEVVVPDDAVRPLEVTVHSKVLRVQPGSEVALRATTSSSDPSSFEVRKGNADWVVASKSRTRTASAAELARRADQQIAAGRSKAAISTLRELVRRHPRSTAAKAATLDLARLHRAAGQRDAAACAYQTYLKRWPTSRLRRDVERNLEQLGGERTCRGLSPR